MCSLHVMLHASTLDLSFKYELSDRHTCIIHTRVWLNAYVCMQLLDSQRGQGVYFSPTNVVIFVIVLIVVMNLASAFNE